MSSVNSDKFSHRAMTQMETALQLLGLKKTKAKVYVAALELGSGSAQAIADRAGVPRTTAHEILVELAGRGLVSYTTKGKRRVYAAEPPAKLRDVLFDQVRRLDAVLPELSALYRTVESKPRVRFYEGAAGMRTVLEDTIAEGNGQLCSILSVVDLFAVLGRPFMMDYVQRRVRQDVTLRVIRSPATEVAETWPTSEKELRELRYAPAAMIFPMTLYVYGNKVSIIGTDREPFGMILESREFAHTFRMLFELLWNTSREGPEAK